MNEQTEKPGMRINYTIIFVSDMNRSVAFYRDLLGIPLKFESPEWTEFSTEGTTLALHRADGESTAADPGKAEGAGRCRPGFQVSDLDEFHRRMIGSGVRCTREPTDIFGVRVAQYLDPDGLEFSVGESRSQAEKNHEIS